MAVDHLGTPRLVTDACAVTRAQHTYYPFGLEATASTQDAEAMKFTGHERDLQGTYGSQTDDLATMHARHYSPGLARFLVPDALRGDPRRPQTFNLFAYVTGNPSTYTDPWGMEGFSDMITVVGTDPWWEEVWRYLPGGYHPSYPGTVGTDGGGGVGAGGTGPLAPTEPERSPQRTCVGVARFSAVGPSQALGAGALGAFGVAPALGTVAVAPEVFGLSFPANTRQRAATQGQLAAAANEISIWPVGLELHGGPRPPYSVSDIGDINIRRSSVPRFDVYRWQSQSDALRFGIQDVPTVILLPLDLTCPRGFEER